jgi:hypothetical protein
MTTYPKCQWSSNAYSIEDCGRKASFRSTGTGLIYCRNHARELDGYVRLVPIQPLTPAKESAIVPPSLGNKLT